MISCRTEPQYAQETVLVTYSTRGCNGLGDDLDTVKKRQIRVVAEKLNPLAVKPVEHGRMNNPADITNTGRSALLTDVIGY